MNVLVMALLLQAGPEPVEAPRPWDNVTIVAPQELGECTMWWYARIRHQSDSSCNLITIDVGPMDTIRDNIVARRDTIIREGFQIPQILEDTSDVYIAPGGIAYVNVRRVCCRQIGPIENWWCIHPDGP